MGKVLSLYLPNLAIDRLQRKRTRRPPGDGGRERAVPAAPTLLVASERGAQVAVHACSQSRRAGVKPGMTVAHARALLPAYAIVEQYEPERDLVALKALARWSLRFTPIAQADPPDGLLMEITGCEHLFGGTQRMLRHVIEQTSRLGLQVQAAIAPTIGAASALARFGRGSAIVDTIDEIPEAIAPLPMRALRVEAETEQALRSVAVKTIGEVLALPRGSLAERFGEALLLRLDQALGMAFEPVEAVSPGEPVRVERAFAGPVKQLEAIMQAGRELVERLCNQLAGHEAGARQLRLTLERIDAENLHETVTLSRPSRDARHLWALLRPRLEQAHMGYGIEQIILHAPSTARLAHRQSSPMGWRDEPRSRQLDREIGGLVDQLTSRFGPSRVSVIEARQTHVPEQAFGHRPVHEAQGERRAAATVVDADRPTLLHGRPQRAEVMLLSPDGPVMTMGRGGERTRIVASVGPERITPRWWLVGSDRRQASPRDYYKVQDERGRWWWLYRQTATSKWFVHGRWC
ncbi:MAG: DNA polymerase Y family protein [Phycisphaeraceae bacterium]